MERVKWQWYSWQTALCVAIAISLLWRFPNSLMDVPCFIGMLMVPFVGFSFTDATDFLPASVIVTAGIYLFIARAPRSERWYQRGRMVAFAIAGLYPLVFLLPVYAQSFRAMALIGKWPPVMYDPKIIGGDDICYQILQRITDESYGYMSAMVWILGLLCISLRRHLHRQDWVWLLLLGTFASSMLFTDRFYWWMD
jgi:hypothetical protein